MQRHGHKSMVWGFTLLELLVALAIFLTVMTMAVSIFLTALKNQRQGFLSQNLQDDARYIMEVIAKEVRMSKIYTATSANSSVLSIKNQNNVDVVYCFTTVDGRLAITRQIGTSCSVQASARLNSSQIRVDGRFYVRNSAGEQPRVTVVLHIYPSTTAQPEMWIEDTITNRIYQ
ncbi:MAG: prepilin-type N-terminal cleavage/methylation domain-containing protein [bacterium]